MTFWILEALCIFIDIQGRVKQLLVSEFLPYSLFLYHSSSLIVSIVDCLLSLSEPSFVTFVTMTSLICFSIIWKISLSFFLLFFRFTSPVTFAFLIFFEIFNLDFFFLILKYLTHLCTVGYTNSLLSKWVWIYSSIFYFNVALITQCFGITMPYKQNHKENNFIFQWMLSFN